MVGYLLFWKNTVTVNCDCYCTILYDVIRSKVNHIVNKHDAENVWFQHDGETGISSNQLAQPTWHQATFSCGDQTQSVSVSLEVLKEVITYEVAWKLSKTASTMEVAICIYWLKPVNVNVLTLFQ